MNLSKLCYFILPPIFFRLMSQIKKKLRKQGNLKINQIKMNLNELRDKGFNYFFDNELILEFCDHLEKDSAVNQPVATLNEKNRQYLDELISKGYCVIRGEFPVVKINKWHDDLKKTMDGASKRCDELVGAYGLASMKNIQENYLGNKTNFELVSGIVRLWDTHITYPELASFHQNETIMDVVGSYFGGNINESSVYVEYKNKVNRYDPNINYHADSPFRLLKVWLLLNDVGPGNGPLVYCEKTQEINDWRILRDLLEYSKCNKKYRASYSHFSRTELAHLANDFPDLCIHEKQITGKAGDIVIADTRGIHGGSTLLDGYRLQLGMVFTGLGNLSIDDIPDKVIKLSKDSH